MYTDFFYDSHALLDIYNREIKAYRPLSVEEEIALAEQVRSGNQQARKHLIEANLMLVIRIARMALLNGDELMDLIQEGNIGLIRAVDMFDPTRGTKFSTFATYWIRKHIQRYQQKNHNDTISLDMEIIVPGEVLFLSDTIEDKATIFGDPCIKHIATQIEQEEVQMHVREQFHKLSPREQKVLKLLYGLESRSSYSIQEVATMMRISKVRVCQLRDRALRKIRKSGVV